MAATAFVVSGVFSRWLHAISPCWTIGGGLVVVGIGSGLIAVIDVESLWSALLLGYLVIGVGVEVLAPPPAAVAMAAVSPQQSATTAGAVNTARQLGLALGVAILGTVLRSVSGSERTTMAQFVSGLDTARSRPEVGIVCGIAAVVLCSARRATAPAEATDTRVPAG